MPFGYKLVNGEVVQIERSANAPTPSAIKRHSRWLAFVKTKSAKLKIKQYLRDHCDVLDDAERAALLETIAAAPSPPLAAPSPPPAVAANGAAGGAAPAAPPRYGLDAAGAATAANGNGNGGGGNGYSNGAGANGAAAASSNGNGASAAASANGAGGDGGPPGALIAKSITIQCRDRIGLLADISGIISRHDHNIQNYSGSKATAGQFVMRFDVTGPDATLAVRAAVIWPKKDSLTFLIFPSCMLYALT